MTTTLYARNPTPMTIAPPGLARLSVVELRKATDTRAGRWLLATIMLIAAITAAIKALTGDDPGHAMRDILSTICGVTALLLPILGVLLVTSEWSQRTVLTTFTLVPRRERIIAAKISAGILLALTATVVIAAVAAVATTVASHGSAPDSSNTWHGALSVIAYSLLLQVLSVILGVGFGLLFLNTPLAVVVFFVIPTGLAILTSSITALHSAGNWLDPSTAWGHLTSTTVTTTTWAQAATAAVIWVAIPITAGSIRVLRSTIT